MSNNLGKYKAIGNDYTSDPQGIVVKVHIPIGASQAFINYAKMYTDGKVSRLLAELASDRLRELLLIEQAELEAKVNKEVEAGIEKDREAAANAEAEVKKEVEVNTGY